jgi:hypothetical protein
MNETLLAQQFELNHHVAHANLEGISHEESLVHPAPAGNCLNWVLGHVVATRNVLMDILGEGPVWSLAEAEPYQRGARPPLDAARAIPLADILAAFDRSQDTLRRRLPSASPDDLLTVARLSFHESYHLGQCGLLRRLLGKHGAIA